MLNQNLVSLLWCPSCSGGGLVPDCTREGDLFLDGVLRCESCGAEFRVERGVPDLKSAGPGDAEEWQTWRNHLKGFQSRRAARAGVASGSDRWRLKLQAFVDFLDVPDGRMLDVGCGPGTLRKFLDPARVTYYGLDPLPLADVNAFPFVCGLAESLPFRAGTFSSLVVRSALDHFVDLDAFFEEASRVLTDDARIFLEQAVHHHEGMTGLVKNVVHFGKDLLDDIKTFRQRDSAPKHMREFSRTSLEQSIQPRFELDRTDTYDANWYTPTQLFISLRRKVVSGPLSTFAPR